MNKIIISIMLLISIALSLSASVPDWYLNNVTDEYPEYILGTGIADINDNKPLAKQQAENRAKQDVASNIFINISGKTKDYFAEIGSGENSSVEEYFINETDITTDIDLMGCEILKKFHNNEHYFILAGVKKNDLKENYENSIKQLSDDIGEQFKAAELLLNSNPAKALQHYEICLQKMNEIKSKTKVLLFLSNGEDISLPNVTLPPENKIMIKLAELQESVPKSESEIANILLADIDEQLTENSDIIIYPFEFENTGFVSDFGNNLDQTLKSKIISITKKDVVDHSKNIDLDKINIITGKMLRSAKGLSIQLKLRNSLKETFITQIFINEVTCKSIGWNIIKPKKLEESLRNKIELSNAIKSDTSLKTELQTDKIGYGPIVYKYNDEPKLLVRTNKACYVRLIYIFSDGTKTLLVDNYYINDDMTNRWNKLPLDLIVTEPSGIEQMLLQSSTKKMPALTTEYVNAGSFEYWIISGELGKEIAKTRGLGFKKNSKIEISEKVYNWTIFEK